MSILDTFIGVVAPHDCLACGREGKLLCDNCVNALQTAPEHCYRCQTKMNKSLTCPECRQLSPLECVHVAVIYGDTAKQLIWQLKLAGAQAAARIMAKRIANLIEENPDAIIVPVPTATSRVRQRGYDQARLLARELSQLTGLTCADCLVRSGQTHQHGSGRRQRLEYLTNAFRVKRQRLINIAHIILVDDVTTTGATLESAAAVLHKAGAARIEAVVFARPQNLTRHSTLK